MKSGLALLLLVVVAGLVECKPSPDLRSRVRARINEIIAKRAEGDGLGEENGEGNGMGKGDGKGMGNGNGTAEGDGKKEGKGGKDDITWPYGWIEFSSLVGKCVTALNLLEIIEEDPPTEGVLAEACPKAFECGEHMLNATEEQLKGVGKFLREIFPLLQCVNLQADKEEVLVSLDLLEKEAEEDLYLKETAPVFAVCDKLFESVKAEIEELEKDEEKIEEKIEEEERETKIKALLRQLINTAAKKR